VSQQGLGAKYGLILSDILPKVPEVPPIELAVKGDLQQLAGVPEKPQQLGAVESLLPADKDVGGLVG